MNSDPDPARHVPSRRTSGAASRVTAKAGGIAPASLRSGAVSAARVRSRGGARRTPATPAQGRLRVTVCDAKGLPALAPGLARWLIGVAPAAARGEVTVVLATDARVRALNKTYLGKDYATDVLSFPGDEPAPAARGAATSGRAKTQARAAPTAATPGADARRAAVVAAPSHLGDVVIARGVAARQARTAGHALATELRVLALHGLLHLLGYDHERDAGEMARVERRLRRRGGLREGLIERAV